MSVGMRWIVMTLVGLAVLGLVAGAAVVGLGLYNVSAKTGHWPGVSWVLNTTYHNSVELRAPSASRVPELTDDMAAIGARHYDSACRFCHAAPGGPRTATATSMVPAPPPIAEAVADWQPRHLFWIVKNGVKMSGMPHWPAKLRRDDVWLVVAFLDRVRDMTAEEYAALVAPPHAEDPQAENPQDADPLVAYCAGCHGLDGAGRGNAAMPRIDILGEAYIAGSLRAYRAGARQSGVMQHAASQLADEQIAMLARRFAAAPPRLVATPPPDLPGAGAAPAPAGDLVALGRTLAFGTPDSRNVPACRACHGPWPTERAALFPALSGQRADYLFTQLTLWHDETRGGTPRAHIMHLVGQDLDEPQMRALAAFYAAGAPLE
jgi:cytochrome c oxidase subunit 1